MKLFRLYHRYTERTRGRRCENLATDVLFQWYSTRFLISSKCRNSQACGCLHFSNSIYQRINTIAQSKKVLLKFPYYDNYIGARRRSVDRRMFFFGVWKNLNVYEESDLFEQCDVSDRKDSVPRRLNEPTESWKTLEVAHRWKQAVVFETVRITVNLVKW